MKVILKQDVLSLGRAGDIKNVKNGYARNFLLPRNLVLPATAKSVKQREFLEQVQARKIQKRKKTAQETATAINGKEFAVTVKVGSEGKLFGSVTNMNIQKEVEKEGFLIDKKLIQLSDHIKTLGIYKVPLKFYEGIEAEITVRVQDPEGSIEVAVAEEVTSEKAVAETQTEEASAETSETESTAEQAEEAKIK